MIEILSLVAPFFGLIFLGFFSGRLAKLPEDGLAWLNFFIIYMALPALFFDLLSSTPLDQLEGWSFIVVTTLCAYIIYMFAVVVAIVWRKVSLAEAAMQGVAGSYSNIGYMGPGLTLSVLGAPAAVPTALIFCFDNALQFILTPILMAMSGASQEKPARIALLIARKILLHPFIVASALGIAAAAIQFQTPAPLQRVIGFLSGAAAPCALFAMGVTIALRPITRIPAEVPWLLFVKLALHPLLIWVLLSWAGDYDPIWVYTAILMASLPPALNVFVMARQYGVWIERASSMVLIGTLVSIPTLTLMILAVTSGVLPADLFPGS
ncbi:MAG: AEC family transporter [Devosiaceae bacterium]|nr:AEC family transporter [Devosiaceae bacterium MH13]